MKKLILCFLAGALLTLAGQVNQADASGGLFGRRWAARFAATMPWHGDYYYTARGAPVALVVPPTVRMHREMGWGVTQTTMLPIWHQFGRSYPEDYGAAPYAFQPTPRWPSHTDQFGVYYVRGPW